MEKKEKTHVDDVALNPESGHSFVQVDILNGQQKRTYAIDAPVRRDAPALPSFFVSHLRIGGWYNEYVKCYEP